MQPPFGSVSLVAEAYERELRAAAARVRPARLGAAGAGSGGAMPGRVCRAVLVGLIATVRRRHGRGNAGAGGDRPPVPSVP